MLAEKLKIIRQEVAAGTGAEIDLAVSRTGVQTSVMLWFADLQRSRSPIVELVPTGLKRIRAILSFGTFAAPTLRQMMCANEEERQLARALVASVATNASVAFLDDQTLDRWEITENGLSIVAEKVGLDNRFNDDSLIATCRELVTPVLGAMAELYGYDPVELPDDIGIDGKLEGSVTLAHVKRRERNPRNRLLCIRLFGEICQICGLDPDKRYGDAGSIIEVHHLQPLSQTNEPRAYDPSMDLIPLCPNCHRAVHTKRPEPWTPAELRTKFEQHG